LALERIPIPGSDVWEMPPGVSLASCVHATRHRSADLSRLIRDLEVDLEGCLGRPFTPTERVTLYHILTTVAGVRRDMGCELFSWSLQYGDVANHRFFHRATVENMVTIIRDSARWELDDDMFNPGLYLEG